VKQTRTYIHYHHSNSLCTYNAITTQTIKQKHTELSISFLGSSGITTVSKLPSAVAPVVIDFEVLDIALLLLGGEVAEDCPGPHMIEEQNAFVVVNDVLLVKNNAKLTTGFVVIVIECESDRNSG
jgi:hypothetical protein